MITRFAQPVLTDDSDSKSAMALTGRPLLVARAAWLIVAVVAIVLSAVGQPALYDQFRTLDLSNPATQATVRANLENLGLPVELYAAYLLILGIVLALGCFAIAAVIFYRRSDEPVALFVALLLVLLGATFSGSIGAAGDQGAVFAWLDSVLSTLSLATVFLVFYLFPDGRFVPRWTRWLALTLLIFVGLTSLVPGSTLDPDHWPRGSYVLFITGLLATGVVAQVYRYRRISEMVERQQTKWVVLGFVVALLGYVIVISLPELSSSFQPGTALQLIAAAVIIGFIFLIPLSFGIAILRYHLWDIDVVINRTLVYGLLTGLLLVLYAASVILLQSLFRAMSGENSGLAIIISTLGIAALFQPLRRVIQNFIDRRFYRRKYDAAQTVTAFSTRMRHEVDLPALTQDLVAVVQATMQPASISLWIRPASSIPTPSTQEETSNERS